MNNLFGDEYIGTYNESANDSGPVTCLGMTFDNDDVRREYFRNELRKKLPELKHIEGFPIGEDEDIINLSDPPYYTACPNPWLNDFIAEWEQEKIELEKQGKRSADFQVSEPYASDVSEGKNNPIYMAHAYHTKVPHSAIMRYILHYTQPGDIVFDGFCGTGMTGVAAQLCGSPNDVLALKETEVNIGVRHAICSDLSPIASLIAATYNLKFNPKEFERKANAILNQVETELGWMYETSVNGVKAKINYTIWSDVFVCTSCGHEIPLWEESVDLEKDLMRDAFSCPNCGANCSKKNMDKAWETYYDSLLDKTISQNKKVPVRINYSIGTKRGEKDVESFDRDLLQKIESESISHLYTVPLKEGYNTSQPIRSNGITHTHQFYTIRNFIYLSRIYNLIKDDLFLKIWFTSILQNASKMYKFRLDRKGGIVNGTLFIPSLNIEQVPGRLLKAKIRDFLQLDYSNRNNSQISINSATSIPNISSSSIDYIFIDPPFGANIMYSELSSIWESWIKVQTNNKEEAIVNSVQGKTLFDYQSLISKSFKEFYRVLKPGKWITIEFSNTSASVWNSIQNSLQGVGFVVANVAALDKKQGSFKAVTTTTAVKQDLVITCYKPTDELINKFKQSEDVAVNVWDFIEELLLHLPVHLEKDMKTTAVVERNPKILFDRLISYYVQRGYPVPMNAQEFQQGLRDRFIERDGMFFTAEQSLEYEQKRAETVSFEAAQSIFVGSEAEGIEWLKRQLDTPIAYQDLQPEWMQALVTPRKGDKLPELLQILEDNFLKDDDGRWYKPNPEKEADKMKRRTANLLKLFNRYVEEASKPKGKIKEARLEALRCGFKDCYRNKDFKTIVTVAQRLPESLVMEDEVLLLYYDIAINRV